MIQNKSSEHLIFAAVKSGETTKVESFLNENTELICAENENGETLLFVAAYHNHIDLVRLLIERGADVDWKSNEGVFPYEITLDDKIEKILYEHSENKEFYPPVDPVFKAVYRKDEEHLRRLLAADSKLVFSVNEEYKSTPLHLAVETDQPNLIRLLLEHGADVNSNRLWESFGEISPYGTPLHLVKSEEAAQILLEHGADVNADGWMGAKPLHEAAEKGIAGIVKLLLEYGADANAPRFIEGEASRYETPLFFADNKEIADLLIAGGADIEERNIEDETPLHWAARYVRLDVAETLIRHGSQTNVVNSSGETPLHSIGSAGDDAKAAHPAQIAHLLIKHDADVKAEDENGWTPLHQAASRGDLETVKVLVENGALVYQQTPSEETTMDIAARYKHQEVVGYLREQLKLNPPSDEPFRIKELCIIFGTGDFIAISRGGELARFSIDKFDKESPNVRLKTEYSSLSSLAVSPEATEFLVVPRDVNFAELRDCVDLSLIEKIYFEDAPYLNLIAFSPDGRWLAAAGGGSVYLMDRTSKKIVSSFRGGERIYSICFDSTSKRLASAHSFQGGGYLQVDEIKPDGEFDEPGQINRSETRTEPEDFVDTLVDVHFANSDRYLVLFETSAIYEEYKSVGWRGNLVAYDLLKCQIAWKAPVNKYLTFDDRSLSEAGFKMGFSTKILIYKDAVYCGATLGRIIKFNLTNGFPLGRYELPGREEAVIFLALDQQNEWLLAILESGDLVAVEID